MDTLYSLMPLILLILIMYFLLIRPQKKKEKQTNSMRNSIKAGDDIITIGGIYGTVVRVRDERLIIQVGADKTKLEITRWAVSKVVTEEATTSKSSGSKKVTEPEVENEPTKKSRPKKLEKTASPAPESTEAEAEPETESTAEKTEE